MAFPAGPELGSIDGGVPAPRAFSSAAADRAAILKELLHARSGEHHIVAIQDYPDPDAISSGLAYREIARTFGIIADITYEGVISHPENLALVSLLEIDLSRYDDPFPLSGYDAAVFVDNQGTTTRLAKRLAQAGVPTLAVIDHHAKQDLLDPLFSDIRPVGAAATLFAEYLASGVFLELNRANPRHVQLATALMHGLHSETLGFVHAEGPEYTAAAFLSAFADTDLLEQVLCIQKSRATMETIEAALGSRVIRDGLSLAGVGYLPWADRDAIPQAADFLLMESDVTTAVVYGIVTGKDSGESIVGSVRASSPTLDVDGFLKRALGKDRAGKYYGGGRARAGGFEIDLDVLASESIDQTERAAKWGLVEREVRWKLFEAGGVEEGSASSTTDDCS